MGEAMGQMERLVFRRPRSRRALRALLGDMAVNTVPPEPEPPVEPGSYRITESGDRRVTEAGDPRVTE